MANKTKGGKHDALWVEAKKRCRLNQEDIRMAKDMGLTPRSLIKNIPAKTQQWKLPVKAWIREMYQQRQEKAAIKQAAKNKTDPTTADHAGVLQTGKKDLL